MNIFKRKIKSLGIRINNIINQKDILKKEYIRSNFPKSIAVSLGEFECIYHCKMCPQSSPERRKLYPKDREMSFETFRRIIDQIPDNQDILFEISALGETLICKTLEDFIRYFKDKKPNISVIIATNGRLLDKERAKKLIKSGLDILSFSLDAGSSQSYKWLCGSDDYNKVCENLQNFVKIRNNLGLSKPIVSTHIIGIKQLEKEFKPFIKRWKNIVDYAVVRPFGNWGGLIDEKECTPLKVVPKKRYPCAWLWYATKILSNGDVVKCFIHPYSGLTKLGNIYSNTLSEIWKSEELNKIRKYHQTSQFDRVELCKDCNVWSLFPKVWKWEKAEKLWVI